MRRVAAGVLCTVLVLFVGPTASANKPAIQRTPVDDEFVDDSCGFDVDVHTTGSPISPLPDRVGDRIGAVGGTIVAAPNDLHAELPCES